MMFYYQDLPFRLVYDLMTLYMLGILLRWFGPWIQLDLGSGRFRWVSRLVDPVVGGVRKALPPLGPMDFAPIATVIAVWLVREVFMLAARAHAVTEQMGTYGLN